MKKIALLGYGRMGKTIDRLLQDTENQVVLRADRDTKKDEIIAGIRAADVVIEFSQPESALNNLRLCLAEKTPVVCGTTGWLAHFEDVAAFAEEQETGFLYASNFSLGVNLFFHLNERLAQLMSKVEGYYLEVSETHHIHKQDAPSGTAITIAEGIMRQNSTFTAWHLASDSDAQKSIPIAAFRESEVPGTHEVTYRSSSDELSIKHQANNRDGFAQGAILAALWVIGKPGVFTMDDVLGLKKES